MVDMNYKEIHILNLGVGVQSSTVYLMKKHKLDFAIFADTHSEPKAVYGHLGWLKSLGGPWILTGSRGNIEEDLKRGENSRRQRFASIPAFTKKEDGSVGLLRRQCTSEYKITVVEQVIRRQILRLKYRQHIPKDIKVYQYFGISMDEARRAISIKKRFEKIPWAEPVFPLLDPDNNYTRQECLEWLKDRVPHQVQRSACVVCPYHDNKEWLSIKENDPESWDRAVETDRALRIPGNIINRGMKGTLYLHRSCLPLDEIDFEKLAREPQMNLFATECDGLCGN